jgi:hypothetical protein
MYLSEKYLTHNILKEGDALSPQLSSFALHNALKKV